MKLYLFERTKNIWYDEYDSAVILAENQYEALKLASEMGWENNHDEWQYYYEAFKNKKFGYRFSEIGEVITELEPRILVSSYNAG